MDPNWSSMEQREAWALQRAYEIMMREGLSLVRAAQWLDKKGTATGSLRLREAITQSLIEALTLDAEAKRAAGQPAAKPASQNRGN